MATKKELYVSVDPREYRQGKEQVLSAQLDVLQTIKHFKALKRLAIEKAKLRTHLHNLFESTLKEIHQIEEKLPTPTIPKSLRKPEMPVMRLKEHNPQSILHQDDEMDEEDSRLDIELQEIQEKLRMLNG